MSKLNESLTGLIERLETIGPWFATGLVDASFLVVWFFLQWLVAVIIVRFPLPGLGNWILIFFRYFFALITLAPILIYIYMDIRVMFIKAQKKIEHEQTA